MFHLSQTREPRGKSSALLEESYTITLGFFGLMCSMFKVVGEQQKVISQRESKENELNNNPNGKSCCLIKDFEKYMKILIDDYEAKLESVELSLN